jgi:hypothetical protein
MDRCAGKGQYAINLTLQPGTYDVRARPARACKRGAPGQRLLRDCAEPAPSGAQLAAHSAAGGLTRAWPRGAVQILRGRRVADVR